MNEQFFDWLKAFSPLETHLKHIYDTTHAPVTESEFFHVASALASMPQNTSEPRDFWYAIEAPVAADFHIQPKHFSNTLDESAFFAPATDIAARKHIRFCPDFIHSHNFYEGVYILSGSCVQSFQFADGTSERISFSEGDFCIIPPGMRHKLAVFDDSLAINIMIRPSFMKKQLNSLVNENHVLFDFFLYTLHANDFPNFIMFHTNGSEKIRSLALDMLEEELEQKNYAQRTLALMLGLIFTYLQRDYSQNIHFSSKVPASISYIPQIIRYIADNYQSVTAASIAARFSFSTSYLSKIFRKHTGQSIPHAIQSIRMEKAREYLRSTTFSIQEICEFIGYQDTTHFIRTFKKYTNCTPLQYRKRFEP